MESQNKYTKQQGVALIGVLIIVALISAAFTFLLQKQHTIFETTKLHLEQSRVVNYFYSIQDLATDKLIELLTDTSKPYVARIGENGDTEKWAFEVPFSTDEISGSAKLVDRSGKLNINQVFVISDNSVGIDATTNFNNCLINLSNTLEVESITPYIVDYLNQQENKQYLTHIGELKKISAIPTKVYQALKSFIYADNSRNIKININTASKNILKCIHSDIDDVIVGDIVDSRPIKDTAELKRVLYHAIANMSQDEINKHILPMLDVKSTFFELHSEMESGDSVFNIRSILIYTSGKIMNHYRSFDYKL
jgi:type II secretory pathway component PulK